MRQYPKPLAKLIGEFAKLLVLSSSYKDSAAQSNLAAANDVPASNQYAPYIRIALSQGWMRTYLGGQFKPDEPVKMQDAAKAVLTLLGYTDEDFSGDITSRWGRRVPGMS